ncbi:MAG: LamG-like jellyroll fold domain-containing protein [Calditrichia bacterium]
MSLLLLAGCSKDPAKPEAAKNSAPQISSIIPVPEEIPMNGTTRITCLADDPEGDPVSYTWESDQGTITGSGAQVDWTAPDSEGVYQIKCTVSDSKKASADQMVSILVAGSGNQPPQITSLSAGSDTVEFNKSISITCQAIDNDGDSLNFDWQITGGTINGSGKQITWFAPGYEGPQTITCTVSDSRGESVSRSIDIEVIPPRIPTDGLVLWYPFNGNARDSSGNAYDGNLLGQANANNGTLEIGNNAVDRVYVPYQSVDGLTNFTAAAWLKIDVVHVPYLNTMFSGANTATHNAFSFWYSRETSPSGVNKTWRIVLHGTGYSFAVNDVIEDLNWHHVAVQRDGAKARLFIDGQQVGNAIDVVPNPVVVAQDGFCLGQEQDEIGGAFSSVQNWAGNMDNVRFYNRPLTADEIRALADEPVSDN